MNRFRLDYFRSDPNQIKPTHLMVLNRRSVLTSHDWFLRHEGLYYNEPINIGRGYSDFRIQGKENEKQKPRIAQCEQSTDSI